MLNVDELTLREREFETVKIQVQQSVSNENEYFKLLKAKDLEIHNITVSLANLIF